MLGKFIENSIAKVNNKYLKLFVCFLVAILIAYIFIFFYDFVVGFYKGIIETQKNYTP